MGELVTESAISNSGGGDGAGDIHTKQTAKNRYPIVSYRIVSHPLISEIRHGFRR